MEKCRICLKFKKNVRSVFEVDRGISFADMLTSVANVKIKEGAYKNIICLPCRKKLRDLYTFKREIERSDLELNKQLNILKFDNISEVKEQLIEKIEDKKNVFTTSLDIDCTTLLKDVNGSIVYRNTTITKNGSYTNCTETKTDLDLDTIDYETDNDIVDFYDDSDYEASRKKKINVKPKKEKEKDERKIKKDSSGFTIVRIKPIFLDDIRVIPAKRLKCKKRKDKRIKQLRMCPHCGKMYSDVESHILVHIGEKKHTCTECNKGFYTSQLLKTHQKKHLNTETFKCDHCVAVFNNKASLKSHMITHIEERNHICPICNKGFKKKYALQRHNLIHNPSAIKCNICKMSFHYQHGLRHHMRVHTGERPFKCEICSQPYSYKHDFNRHCLKKHGVFLKRRQVYVMNEEVLKKERALMKDLMLRVQGVKQGEPLNPFKGPTAALAFNAAVKALGSCQIPIDAIMNC